MEYYVYMLLCSDGSYYTGHTQNLKNRFKQHLGRRGSRYTRIKRVEKVVYIERFNARSDAMRREREIKRLTHNEKSDLIKSFEAD